MKEILISVVVNFFGLLQFFILVSCVLSWFPVDRENRVFKLVSAITNPILEPISSAMRKSPLGGGGMQIDFSPVIAYVILEALANLARLLGA